MNDERNFVFGNRFHPTYNNGQNETLERNGINVNDTVINIDRYNNNNEVEVETDRFYFSQLGQEGPTLERYEDNFIFKDEQDEIVDDIDFVNNECFNGSNTNEDVEDWRYHYFEDHVDEPSFQNVDYTTSQLSNDHTLLFDNRIGMNMDDYMNQFEKNVEKNSIDINRYGRCYKRGSRIPVELMYEIQWVYIQTGNLEETSRRCKVTINTVKKYIKSDLNNLSTLGRPKYQTVFRSKEFFKFLYSLIKKDPSLYLYEIKKKGKLSKREKRENKRQLVLKKAEVKEKIEKEKAVGLRSPICCVLGHVDTGKTKILDNIRRTNVQEKEAGGITQSIGGTYIPIEAVKKRVKKLTKNMKLKFKVPGLLIIDTPGHESFSNLRARGSSLCDIAILVVDIMHGIERQTVESIDLLRRRRTPFVVALNKVDQLNDWKANENCGFQETLKKQEKHTQDHFYQRLAACKVNFQERKLNSCLYYKNKDFIKYVSLVPCSAITGEGLPDLLTLMVQLTQKLMVKRITYNSELDASILEAKFITGYGHTIDVVLSNGILQSSDRIVVCTLGGPVCTHIRSLLTPKPLKEIRVKGEWLKHKYIRASQGVKIVAPGLEGAVAGTQLLVVKEGDDIDVLKEEVMKDMEQVLSRITTTGKGVYVQASSLGALEALLDFLKVSKIPVSGISIGPVNKRDVVNCSSMLEIAPEYAVILAFNVKVSKDAENEAKKFGITIFVEEIIYHLFDNFVKHQEEVKRKKREELSKAEIIWPCTMKIRMRDKIRASDPIIVGVDIERGFLIPGVPICTVLDNGKILELGRVSNIQSEKKVLKRAEKGECVAISFAKDLKIILGKHLLGNHKIYTKISRKSIDVLKLNYTDEVMANKREILIHLSDLKKLLDIPTMILK